MDDKIDLDEVERATLRQIDGREPDLVYAHGAVVLALVRAVRAASNLGSLWHDGRGLSQMDGDATTAELTEFNTALEPFRKEAP